jgi:hypothetical protein
MTINRTSLIQCNLFHQFDNGWITKLFLHLFYYCRVNFTGNGIVKDTFCIKISSAWWVYWGTGVNLLKCKRPKKKSSWFIIQWWVFFCNIWSRVGASWGNTLQSWRTLKSVGTLWGNSEYKSVCIKIRYIIWYRDPVFQGILTWIWMRDKCMMIVVRSCGLVTD